jgi:hypothetical protein
MSIALDVGAYRFRSLRVAENRLVTRGCRAVYSVVPASDGQKRLLRQVRIAYGACDDGFVLMGDASEQLAHLFQIRTRDLMPGGRIPQDDPLARQVISVLIESLLPEPRQEHEICSLVLPVISNPTGGVADQGEEWELLAQLVRLRGYQPVAYGSAMGLMLATLVEQSFTGIGMVFGASHCDVSIAHRGTEVCHCSIPRGSTWIDEQMAQEANDFGYQSNGERYLDTPAQQRLREQFAGSLVLPRDPYAKQLSSLYGNLVAEALKATANMIEATPRAQTIPQPVTVVCGGGAARTHGFAELLAHALEATPLPLATDQICVATESDATVARGALISAELESQTRSKRSAAA